MDATFLKATVGDALVRAMAEVAKYQPPDPIHHISEMLRELCGAGDTVHMGTQDVQSQNRCQETQPEDINCDPILTDTHKLVAIDNDAINVEDYGRNFPTDYHVPLPNGYAQLTTRFPSTIAMFCSSSAVVSSINCDTLAASPLTKEMEGAETDEDVNPSGNTYFSLTSKFPSTVSMFAFKSTATDSSKETNSRSSATTSEDTNHPLTKSMVETRTAMSKELGDGNETIAAPHNGLFFSSFIHK